jgi:CTP-dependent riboflavin kinase
LAGKEKKFSGVIFSDLGQASSFMSLDWVQSLLRERLGFVPYPATLNLRVESEEEMAVWREIRRTTKGMDVPPPDASFCHASCYSVEIQRPDGNKRGKLKAAVLVPEVEGYPPDKVEVIAPVRVKDELRVRDGDRITLEFVDS